MPKCHFFYKLHVKGTLDGIPIDRKYCTIKEFLAEYGGDKTRFKLNNCRIERLRAGLYQKSNDKRSKEMKEHCKLTFHSIHEARPMKCVMKRKLVSEIEVEEEQEKKIRRLETECEALKKKVAALHEQLLKKTVVDMVDTSTQLV